MARSSRYIMKWKKLPYIFLKLYFNIILYYTYYYIINLILGLSYKFYVYILYDISIQMHTIASNRMPSQMISYRLEDININA